MILSSIVTNALWYWTIASFGTWICYVAVAISAVAAILTYKYIPADILKMGYTAQITKGYVISAAMTAVCQIVIAACLDSKIGAVMTIMWMTWYAISFAQYLWAKNATTTNS
jgi:hypothetical protein